MNYRKNSYEYYRQNEDYLDWMREQDAKQREQEQRTRYFNTEGVKYENETAVST